MVIDTDNDAPELIRPLADLNPLAPRRGPVCPKNVAQDAYRRARESGKRRPAYSAPRSSAPGRQEQDLEVEPERPVLDVVVVALDAVRHRGLAAQAVDLRPAGHAGLDAMAVGVAVDDLVE